MSTDLIPNLYMNKAHAMFNAKECVGDSMPKNIFNQEIKVIRAVFNKKIAIY